MQSKQWVTFEDNPKKDAGTKEPHLPTWGDKKGTGDPSDWSRQEEKDLKCLLPLNPHIQEFLGGEEMPLAGVEVGDSLQWTSMPEPSPRGVPSGSSGVHSSWTQWPGGEN